MEREVRYCTTEDGVRIAFSVEGEGPVLLCQPFFLESLALIHLGPSIESVLSEIGIGRRLVLFDLRGTGLSQRDVDDVSPAALLLDTEAVVRALGVDRLSLFGAALGGPRTIAYAAAHPDTVQRLVLTSTFARLADILPVPVLQSFSQLARANWDVASRTLADLSVRQRDDREGLDWARWFRDSVSGEVVARYIESHMELDVSEELGKIQCPTLVVHEVSGSMYPFECGQQLAQGIPSATFLPLEPQGTTTGLGTESIAAIVDFLNEAPLGSHPRHPKGSSEADLRTVLFTDLVGHTEMMSRLGDERGREVLREQERITREVLKAHAGTEVKTMGDGFMASFTSVTKAVECAVALQKAFAERNAAVSEPLHVRVGLNAGEPIEEEGDLFGSTVILASRIAAKADGGEILVADTVRGLCSGKGFLFADRGEFVAKGFEEPVRVFQVSWQS